MIFISSPYSNNPSVNYDKVALFCAQQIAAGEFVFSPVVMGHHLLPLLDIPGDWSFWSNYCEHFLSKCDKMIVLVTEGWDSSVGVAEEIKIADRLKIPIYFHQL
jgi:hypothetical protein